MKTRAFTATALLMSTLSLVAADKVEITGIYEIEAACYETFHEETTYIVEPGKDKFSGIQHVISLTAEQKKKLRSGTKVKITGRKQAAVTKTMTKGDVRKAMYTYLKDYAGIMPECTGMAEIINKIAEKPADGAGAHDHGTLELKAVEDDAEEIEVTIPAHIVTETIETLN